MRVTVHPEVCIGSGQCVIAASRVFDQDDTNGLVRLRVNEPAPSDAGAVREAVERCPSGAIGFDAD